MNEIGTTLKLFIGALMFLSATASHAETLYKVVGTDGKITYTDRPPVDGKSTALKFVDAPTSPLPESVLKYQAELRKSMQGRLSEAKKTDSSGATTLFMATWCGYCTRAKAYLNAKGIRYQEVDIDTAEGARAFVDAGGSGGVPLLLIAGQRARGFSEASYDKLFAVKK